MIRLHRGNLRMLLIVLCVVFMSYKAVYFNFGLGIYFVGLLIHLISKGFLYRNQQLAVKGPYSFVRHPFYAANFLLDTGIIFMAGYPIFVIIYMPLYYVCYHKVILNEETELINIYGEQYKEYMSKVPRYFPTMAPYMKDWHKGFQWENILREREVSRLIRLISYPVSFLIIYEIKKYRLHEPSLFRVEFGICLVIILLWISYLFHNMIERDRMFKNRSRRTINLFFWIIIGVIIGILVFLNKMGMVADYIILPLVLVLFSIVVSFILFIIADSVSSKMKNKFK